MGDVEKGNGSVGGLRGVRLEGQQDCPWLVVFWMGLELRVAEGPGSVPCSFQPNMEIHPPQVTCVFCLISSLLGSLEPRLQLAALGKLEPGKGYQRREEAFFF